MPYYAIGPADIRRIRREIEEILANTTRTHQDIYREFGEQWGVHPRTIERLYRRQTFGNVQ